MRILPFGFCSLLLLVGCGLLDPATQATALEVVEQLAAQGAITSEQSIALRQAVLADGRAAWWSQLLEVVAAAGLAYVGVAIRRGPPTQRVGLPADLVRPIAASRGSSATG